MGLVGCLNACACLVGSDVNSVDFVDSGSAMRKTVARQNAKLEGGSSKPDFVIWEIEVPKVTSCWPAHHPALPYTATSWSAAGSVPSQGDQQPVQDDWSLLLPLGLRGEEPVHSCKHAALQAYTQGNGAGSTCYSPLSSFQPGGPVL